MRHHLMRLEIDQRDDTIPPARHNVKKQRLVGPVLVVAPGAAAAEHAGHVRANASAARMHRQQVKFAAGRKRLLARRVGQLRTGRVVERQPSCRQPSSSRRSTARGGRLPSAASRLCVKETSLPAMAQLHVFRMPVR